MSTLKLAIVGCGAVTNLVHLPVVTESEDAEVTLLIDKLPEQARNLAKKYKVANTATDIHDILGKVDAAIVALPHDLHAPISIELMQNGIHVLVEKPMAMSSDECNAMIEAARKGNAVLTVGMARRFYASSQFVKKVLQSGLLGDVVEFDFREGFVYNWPVASDFMFRKDKGGGVLTDTGSHVLDLVLWWLGDYEHVEYSDDAMGGVEANCELRLKMQNGADGFVELSRTRELRNTYIIRGTEGRIEVEAKFNPLIRLTMNNRNFTFAGQIEKEDGTEVEANDVFCSQFEDFIAAVRGESKPLVPGQEGLGVVKLIETCQKVCQPFEQPWVQLQNV